MILDRLLQFSLAAGDVPTTTAVSGNIIDLGLGLQTTTNPLGAAIPSAAQGGGARDIGIGDKPAMKLLVQVLTTFAGGTSLAVALQGAVDTGAGAPAAFSTWWTSPAYALATLNAGSRLLDMDMPRPPDGIAMPRYLQLNYTIVGTMSGGGSLGAFIVLDRDDQIYNGLDNAIMGGYPPGITVAN